MKRKYFTEKQIYSATFFGGPIPPGILIYKNLRRINNDRKASLVLMFTFIFTLLFFFFLFQTVDTFIDKIPDFVFTAFYTIVVYLLYHNFFREEIKEKISEPDNKESNWHVAGWTLLGFIANLIIIIGIAFLEPAFPGEKLTFGKVEHEVFYDKESFSESQVNKVGKLLIDFEYFYGEIKQSARLEIRDEQIFLLLPFHKDYWNDQSIVNEFYNFNSRLSYELQNVTNLELIHYELNGDKKTKRIALITKSGS